MGEPHGPPPGVDELVDWRNVTGITTHYQLSLASQRPELTSLGYKPGNHTDPGPNQRARERAPDSAAGAGQDCALALQITIHVPSPPRCPILADDTAVRQKPG